MARNGIIELSYARSAGTGDQPVAGTITSRRNSSRAERVQQMKKREIQEENSRKQRLEQEAVARILTQKWEEEDRRKRDKRRRKEDDESDDERLNKRRFKESSHSLEEADQDDMGDRQAEEKPERGEWISVGREDAGSDAGPADAASAELLQAPRGDSQSRRHSASSSKPTARSRSAVPGVFGLSDSEEEAAGMKREMERAAKTRRQRMSLHAEAQQRATETSRGAAGSRGPPSDIRVDTARGEAPDLCTQLMKVAEWKRSCGGKRLPMPEEMKLEVAKAMGANV